jgi:predicted DNA-binding transcriptional regulator YafY
VARRCLAVINRLQQGPATKQELLTAVYRTNDSPADWQKLATRFENDKMRLRDKLGIPIRYDKRGGGYVIAGWERPLLNLPDDDIETLAFLADTFQSNAPKSVEVHQLIDRLVSWLPPERQKLVQKIAGQQPTADLRLRDSEEIAPDVWENILEAWQAKQEVLFDYLSSRHEDGIVRQHHVQPWDLAFTERGHWRLRGFCLFNDGPNGPWKPMDYWPYRLSRIVSGSVEILPRKLPGVRPFGKPRTVVFELSPVIGRFGVSQRKELLGEPVITVLESGWTRVEGRTHDVFGLARNLLYYGANCRVLGGDELLREMRGLVADLVEVYQ